MNNEKCETCRHAVWHGNYDKPEPMLCMNDKSGYLMDFMNKDDGCKYYEPKPTQNLRDIVIEFRQYLLSDQGLYDAFVASIESAIRELPPRIDRECAARRIADRIIGREE